jgi:heparosan-N-sulfate-glucuronate 5-epimerase
MDFDYYKRLVDSYILRKNSHLNFWHCGPEVNYEFNKNEIGQYYMPFINKAKYDAYFDDMGVPLLNYQGCIGSQYNPIAISQYGLGNYNLFLKKNEEEYKNKALIAADWMVNNLKKNSKGIPVWMHDFDWRYIEKLKAPWYSGLAQGQGISLLIRASKLKRGGKYLETSKKGFISLEKTIDKGGVLTIDDDGNKWVEEYLVEPPSHILNGFLWAIFGVYDYFLFTGDEKVKNLFDDFVKTIKNNIHRYDIGFWSLYDLSGGSLKNISSHFYHKLHIVQLKILSQLTEDKELLKWAEKWEGYWKNSFYRKKALFRKFHFKIKRC